MKEVGHATCWRLIAVQANGCFTWTILISLEAKRKRDWKRQNLFCSSGGAVRDPVWQLVSWHRIFLILINCTLPLVGPTQTVKSLPCYPVQKSQEAILGGKG